MIRFGSSTKDKIAFECPATFPENWVMSLGMPVLVFCVVSITRIGNYCG